MGEAGYVSFKEFNETVKELRKETQDNTKQIIELKTVYQALSGLPEAIQKLNVNMALMKKELEQTNEKFDKFVAIAERENVEQNQKISNMNDKSKIDVVEIIRDNWLKVAFILYVVAQSFAK